MDLPSIITYVGDVADAITSVVPKIIASCSILAAFLPPPDRAGPLSKLHALINAAAFNIRHAENK